MKPILVFGDVILDVDVTADVGRCPELSDVPKYVEVERRERLGGAANVAGAIDVLAPWSVELYTVSTRLDLQPSRVRTRGVRDSVGWNGPIAPDSERVTRTRVRDRAGRLIARLDSPRHLLSQDTKQAMLRVLGTPDDLRQRCSAVVISDYDMDVVSDEAVDVIRSSELPFFVDTKRPDLRAFRGAYAVKLNASEHDAQLVNRDYIAAALFDHYIVTRAAAGAELHYYEKLGRLPNRYRNDVEVFPAPPVTARDVVGCGDTFLGALVHSNVQLGWDIRRAIRFATFCASQAVKKIGDCLPDPDAIEQFQLYENK